MNNNDSRHTDSYPADLSQSLDAKFYSSIIIFILATILILNHAWIPGMFMDGNIYAALSKNMANGGPWLIPEYAANEFPKFYEHPPFIFMIQALIFKIVGISWTTARLMNFLFFTGIIYFLYQFICEQKNKKAAFYTILILTLCMPLIKKSRFPNMDIPLTFFTLLSLSNYYKAIIKKQTKSWIYTGLFFGLALLCKGHPALIIPFIIFTHLIFSKNLKVLLSGTPWFSFLLGLLIFSLWPFLLYMNGSIDIFILWFQKQFTTTVIQGRGKSDFNFFTYFFILSKVTLPWFLLAIYTTINYIKKPNSNPLVLLALCWFWPTLIALSMVRFKYGHYILPLYPALAILAGYSSIKLEEKLSLNIAKAMIPLTIITGAILLFLPSMSKIKRSPEIIHSQLILEKNKITPDAWAIVDGSYSYWDFSSTLTFMSHSEAYRFNEKKIIQFMENGLLNKSWAFLIKKNTYEKIKDHPQFNKKLKVLTTFEKKNLLFLIDKSLSP